MKIDWSGPLTKGRQVYAALLELGAVHNINYDNGYLIGWDQWSDNCPIDWYPRKQGWMGL